VRVWRSLNGDAISEIEAQYPVRVSESKGKCLHFRALARTESEAREIDTRLRALSPPPRVHVQVMVKETGGARLRQRFSEVQVGWTEQQLLTHVGPPPRKAPEGYVYGRQVPHRWDGDWPVFVVSLRDGAVTNVLESSRRLEFKDVD